MDTAKQRPIRFIHRQEVVEVQGLPPTTTVLGWLREHAHCTGTKEGCNEGDCGACTVVVSELQSDSSGAEVLRSQAVNACLIFLPSLDGKALSTVEDLKNPHTGALHPVQQAMVDHHGSQCGFCTPGFVMSMVASHQQFLDQHAKPSRREWADALAGNLCRCTGYRPILDAAQACSASACKGLWDAPEKHELQKQLRALKQDGTLHYRAWDPAIGEEASFIAPRTGDELAQCYEKAPHSRLLAGATDVALWTNKQHRKLGPVISTMAAADLRSVERVDGALRIGAAVKLEQAWLAMYTHMPVLRDLWLRFASPPVRHLGTLVGNVANGSPIGDGAPVLMALGSHLVVRKGSRIRELPLDTFYTDYQKNALEPGEFISHLWVPLPQAHERFGAWKVAKRYDSDISAVCGAFFVSLAGPGQGPALRHVRLAFGGMAATVRRAPSAEAALSAHGWTEAGVRSAMAALPNDFQPLSDLRARAEYRLEVAAQLLWRWWLQQGNAASPAPLDIWTEEAS